MRIILPLAVLAFAAAMVALWLGACQTTREPGRATISTGAKTTGRGATLKGGRK